MLTSLLALTVLARTTVAGTIERSWQETRVVGHRGAASVKPENTIASFEEAISAGADATECDVHTSLDGDLVVLHDATLDRTTSLKGAVATTPTSTLREAGVPFLADFTRTTRDRIIGVVEIKGGVEVERKVVDHLKAERMVDQTIVFSFGAERIQRVKQLNPDQFGVWLVGLPVDPANLAPIWAKLAEIKADGVGVQFRNCPLELASEARRRKIPLFVWTVPPGPEVDRLKALRVNFIITDHPREVRAQLGLTG